MSFKKDKQKVLGEHFDDDRIKTFLEVEPYGNLSRDYCALEKAYRGMIAENFATFVQFFTAAGMDINAKNADGKTLLQVAKTHRNSDAYIEALVAAGAQ